MKTMQTTLSTQSSGSRKLSKHTHLLPYPSVLTNSMLPNALNESLVHTHKSLGHKLWSPYQLLQLFKLSFSMPSIS